MDIVEPYVLPSYMYKVKRAFFSMTDFKKYCESSLETGLRVVTK